MYVQGRRLARQRSDHVRLTMTDHWHVVVDIEVCATRSVVQPDAFAAHDVQWLVVKERRTGTEQARAARHQIHLCAHGAHGASGSSILTPQRLTLAELAS